MSCPATTFPPRYPDAHPSGTPDEHYNATSSTLAFSYAREIMDTVDEAWRALQSADEDSP